ncbi:MAG: NUMOD4 motif-containing HNH endonuclease [Bryobacteraceae bacterium]
MNHSTPQDPIEWRPIPGFPSYEASERGDIRRAVSFRHYPAGMVLRQRRNRFGYMTVRLSERGIARDVFVHRLVALAFIGPQPTPQHEVAHGDGSRDNNHWANLRWATPSENALDRRRHGRLPDTRGEKHPMARLTNDLVLALRSRRRAGALYREIADEFGFPKLTVYDAVTGKTWSHI